MNVITKTSRALEHTLAATLAALLGIMVLTVTWQVVSRFVIGNPSSFTEEMARFLLMWIGLLGSAYAFRTRSHLSLDLLMQNAALARKLLLVRFAAVCGFVFAGAAMVYGGVSLMMLTLSLKQTSTALGLPIGLVYSCIPISGLLICWFAVDMFLHPIEPEHSSSLD